jgi:hypothetical protein
MCYVYLSIHWIFEVVLRYLLFGSIFLAARNHRIEFTLVFRFTSRFENCFGGSFIAFGKTMHDLSNRPIYHKRFVELHAPINLLMIIYLVDCHNLLIRSLEILCLNLVNWMYNVIWLEWVIIMFLSFHTFIVMISLSMVQIFLSLSSLRDNLSVLM